MEQGVICKGIGGFYYVRMDADGRTVECKARGRFRRQGIKPTVGDHVQVNIGDDGKGYLDEILPRKNHIIRPAIANVDRAFVVITPCNPEPNLLLIDKILAICAVKDIEAFVVINKTDLEDGEELADIYARAGYPVICASAITGKGMEEIRAAMQGHISFFSGSSGIGKSSMINQLVPGICMEVGDISKKISRGRHTTRHVELFPLEEGGYLADTPGFSSFDIEKLDVIKKDQLIFGFPDILKYSHGCRFTGCSHTCEKGCRVLDAVVAGDISPSRHESYVKLYEQLKNVKEWEQ